MKKILFLILLLDLFSSCATRRDKSLQTQFDELFKYHGGRVVKLPDYFEGMRILDSGLCSQTIKGIRMSKPDLPNVYVDFINDSSINARSNMNEDGNYFIGINLGTLVLLQDAFLRMLSSKNVLSDFGDTSKEVNPPKIKSLQVYNLKDIDANGGNKFTLIAPRDSFRFYLAEMMVQFAIQFIVNHEYGHILNGHILFRQANKLENSLDEVGNGEFTNDADSILFSHDMEIDADAFAARFAIKFGNVQMQSLAMLNPMSRQIFKDWKTYLRLWMFSTYSIFKILGNKRNSSSISFHKSHPPPSVRNLFVLASAGELLVHITDTSGMNLLTNCINTWDEVDRAFSQITDLDFDLFEMRFVNDSATREKMEDIANNFPIYRSVMQKYSFIKSHDQ